MAQYKPLTIHYRRLSDSGDAFGSKTLEQSIRDSMKHRVRGTAIKDSWHHRARPPSSAGDDTLLMNEYHDNSEAFFGDLTQYTSGHMQALLDQEKDAATLNVEQKKAPKGKEYIHSIMYWLVKGNHLFAIQSVSLQAKHLEEYLTWLLRESSVINRDANVVLAVKFDVGEIGGDLEDIKEIIVGGEVHSTPPAPKERDSGTYQKTVTKKAWHEKAMAVLRAVMNDEADVQELLQDMPDEDSLQVDVRIGYKTRKRNYFHAPMQQALRNLPQGDIIARGKTGKLTGQDIRLSYPVAVKLKGSLIDSEDAREKLSSAYTYFVENGKIEP